MVIMANTRVGCYKSLKMFSFVGFLVLIHQTSADTVIFKNLQSSYYFFQVFKSACKFKTKNNVNKVPTVKCVLVTKAYGVIPGFSELRQEISLILPKFGYTSSG